MTEIDRGDFPAVLEALLQNWAAWTRVGSQTSRGVALSAIYGLGEASTSLVEGWHEPGAPDEPECEPFEPAAQRVEALLIRLPRKHRKILIAFYSERRYIPRELLDPAKRALVDLCEEERVHLA